MAVSAIRNVILWSGRNLLLSGAANAALLCWKKETNWSVWRKPAEIYWKSQKIPKLYLNHRHFVVFFDIFGESIAKKIILYYNGLHEKENPYEQCTIIGQDQKDRNAPAQ